MRLTYVADFRSPIALQWVRYFVERGHSVQAISSYPMGGVGCAGAEVHVVPLVLAGRQAPMDGKSYCTRSKGPDRHRLSALATPSRVAAARSKVGPLLVKMKRRSLQRLVDRHRPDLVHAMRIPFEGMVAASLVGPPLVVSTWGNDLTLFADRSPAMGRATRRALSTAAAVHCDCGRDAQLARKWGLRDGRPVWVLPGNGGVDATIFHPGPSILPQRMGIPAGARIVVNPRGVREYVRNDVFFRALSPVLATFPDVHVVCPGMAASVQATRLAGEVGSGADRIHLLPKLDAHEMADLFRAATTSVSLSTHDGTPNTLLEAMACGTLPVVGDLDSIREWIEDQRNGLIVRADDPASVSTAILRALRDKDLAGAASRRNQMLVRTRADYSSMMRDIESRYQLVADYSTGH